MSADNKQNEFTLDLYTLSQNLFPNTLKGACLNKNCKLDRLYCQTCEQDHIQHINDTFSFYQIQQSFFENPKDNIKYFYELLELVKQSITESTKRLQDEFCSVIDHYQEQFPQIKNFSYHQMDDYINRLVTNIRQINQNIMFNNPFGILHNVKQKIQTIINKLNDEMDDIILLFNDFSNLDYQDIRIQKQLQKETIFQFDKKQDIGQLKCNDPTHKHTLNIIKKLCLFADCDQYKLICSRSYDNHFQHKKLLNSCDIIQINLFQIDEDQAKLISFIQQQIRQLHRELQQHLQHLSMPHLLERKIFNKLFSNESKNDVVEEIKQFVFVHVESGVIKYRLAEIKYLKQYIQERIQKLSSNLQCL